ncbi:hypothetical protein G9A89_022884 [Geosiphon pyriformis]|nr:hypothetical protein G9A89_022884 [Geosiphon pyriformis]
MTLINRATQEDVCQMKEAEYIKYTMKLARFDYENEVETYHQIAKKAHEIDTRYDQRYPGKDILVLQPNKKINVREGVIDARYTGDIIIILQNKTDKPFRIEHVEKIVQAIYLSLINILGLQSVNNREQLEKNERRTQDFGLTGQFTVPVNIAFNIQNESHQIFQLP